MDIPHVFVIYHYWDLFFVHLVVTGPPSARAASIFERGIQKCFLPGKSPRVLIFFGRSG